MAGTRKNMCRLVRIDMEKLFMAKINFGGVEEEVVTRDEFPLEKAQEVLKDEVVAVLGYGVQGPAQALNMRDNGINVIVGQKGTGSNWDKAVADGWVPGETLFSARRSRRARHGDPVPGFGCRAGGMWPKIVPCLLNPGDALYFSHGFRSRLQRPDRHHPARRT
jgi:ketol-acid reductoisomerase